MANYGPSSQEEDGYSHRQLGQVNRRGRGLKRPQGASFYEDNGPYRGFNAGGQQGIPNGGYYGPQPPPPPPLMGLPSSSENDLVAENEKLRRDLKRSTARENIAAQTLSAYSLLVRHWQWRSIQMPPLWGKSSPRSTYCPRGSRESSRAGCDSSSPWLPSSLMAQLRVY